MSLQGKGAAGYLITARYFTVVDYGAAQWELSPRLPGGEDVKLAVITPYYSETMEQLVACHESVAKQTIAGSVELLHLMVNDGRPPALAASIPGVMHMVLPTNSSDTGATPRGIGMAVAWTIDDLDGVLFLDGDNTFALNHVESMVAVQQATGADVVTCPRVLIRPDGSTLGLCTESDGDRFNDTNCYLIIRSAWPVVGRAWLCQPRHMGLWADRLVWEAVRNSGVRLARSPHATVDYVTLVESHYLERGETPPEKARNTVIFEGKAVYMDNEQYRAWVQEQAMLNSGSQA